MKEEKYFEECQFEKALKSKAHTKIYFTKKMIGKLNEQKMRNVQ